MVSEIMTIAWNFWKYVVNINAIVETINVPSVHEVPEAKNGIFVELCIR